MKDVLQNSKIALFAWLFIIVFSTSAWQTHTDKEPNTKNNKQTFVDTTKPGSVYTDKIDLGINTDSILNAAQSALSAIDFNKMQQQINASIASINLEEINKSIEASLKNIDWNKMKADVSKSLDLAKVEIAKVNTNEIKAELEKAKAELAKVNTTEIKDELEKAKAELKSEQFKQKIDLSNLRKEVDENMSKAKIEIEKAKAEIANYKNLVAALQNDGLIKAGEPYKVELRDDMLYINGVKQTKETTEKYRKYYQGKTHFSIYDNKQKANLNEDEDKGTDL